MRSHISIIAWLHIAISGLYVLGACMFFVFFAGAGVVAAASSNSGTVGALFAGIGTLLAGGMLLVGAPGIVIGYFMLKHAPWARIAGIVLSILMLLNLSTVGVTTVIGIYSLWVLFNPETVAIFEGRGDSGPINSYPGG